VVALPFNNSAEEAVLGSVLLDGSSISRVSGLLDPDDFYNPAHGLVYFSMLRVSEGSGHIDLITLRESLAAHGLLERAGGEAALARLTTAVATAAGIENYARIVKEKSVLRKVALAGVKIQQHGSDESLDPLAALRKASDMLEGIQAQVDQSGMVKADIVHVADRERDALDRLVNKDRMASFPCGIPSIDRLWHGMEEEEVVVIAGDTAHGKSMLMQRIALNCAESGTPVLYFSLEMSVADQVARFYQMSMTAHGTDAAKEVSKLPIWFYGGSSVLTTALLDTVIGTAVREHVVRVCFVDHLHYFARSTEHITEDVANAFRDIKRFARKYKMPIVLITVLRKRMRPRSMPDLEDLKDTVMIGYDADIVTMVWRDIMGEEHPKEHLRVFVRKNRNRNDVGSAVLTVSGNHDLIDDPSVAAQYRDQPSPRRRKGDLSQEASEVFQTNQPYKD